MGIWGSPQMGPREEPLVEEAETLKAFVHFHTKSG